MSYYNKYGLINSDKNEEVSENTALLSLEHIILTKLLDEDPSYMEVSLIEYFEKLRNPSTSRFNDVPEGSTSYITPSQYTTLCAFSHRHGLNFHKEFWNKVKYGTYDNISGEFNSKRAINPKDLIYIGYLNDNKLCKLTIPLLCVDTILAFMINYKNKASKQLLTLVRNYGLNGKSTLFNLTWKLCTNISNRKSVDGYKGIFNRYFENEDHPNRVLARRINNYNLD